MKKLVATLALAAATTAHAGGAEVVAGVILGAVIAQQPRVIVQPPPTVVYQGPVMVIPQQIYSPHPVYTNPHLYPVPRVITSSEPCQYYGQMVMTFDQWGRPIGHRNCQ